MKIITLANQKGGVGKTTTSNILSTGLAEKGYKVLAIDLDGQQNLSKSFLISNPHNTIYDVLKGSVDVTEAIYKVDEKLHFIPSAINLTGADLELSHQVAGEFLLKEKLEPIKENYDYVIIDTPPSLGIILVNSLIASDEVIIPMETAMYSCIGTDQLIKTINKIKNYYNPNLKIAGILITMYEKNTIVSKKGYEFINSYSIKNNINIFKSKIRKGTDVAKAQWEEKTLFMYKSNVTKDYMNFINEFILSKEN